MVTMIPCTRHSSSARRGEGRHEGLKGGGVVGRKEAEGKEDELTATVSVTGEKLHYRDLKCDSIYMAHIDLLFSVVDGPLSESLDSNPKLVQVNC